MKFCIHYIKFCFEKIILKTCLKFQLTNNKLSFMFSTHKELVKHYQMVNMERAKDRTTIKEKLFPLLNKHKRNLLAQKAI